MLLKFQKCWTHLVTLITRILSVPGIRFHVAVDEREVNFLVLLQHGLLPGQTQGSDDALLEGDEAQLVRVVQQPHRQLKVRYQSGPGTMR